MSKQMTTTESYNTQMTFLPTGTAIPKTDKDATYMRMKEYHMKMANLSQGIMCKWGLKINLSCFTPSINGLQTHVV
uniref:hypothetical protein n=1 Tax=Neobacillus dielmonensis TaxID=1347369 RepID=UPI0005AB2E39